MGDRALSLANKAAVEITLTLDEKVLVFFIDSIVLDKSALIAKYGIQYIQLNLASLTSFKASLDCVIKAEVEKAMGEKKDAKFN